MAIFTSEYNQCYSVTDEFKPFSTECMRFIRTIILSALIYLARQVQMFVNSLVILHTFYSNICKFKLLGCGNQSSLALELHGLQCKDLQGQTQPKQTKPHHLETGPSRVPAPRAFSSQCSSIRYRIPAIPQWQEHAKISVWLFPMCLQ